MKRPSSYMTMTDGVTQHDYKRELNKYIDYLEAENKQLILSGVSNRRELLFAYEKQTQIYEYDEFDEWNTNKKIDQYLSE